jgi:hypothetical protein
MMRLIPGLIAMAMLVIYLGYYMVGIFFVPLTLVIIGVAAMAIGDFITERNGDQT